MSPTNQGRPESWCRRRHSCRKQRGESPSACPPLDVCNRDPRRSRAATSAPRPGWHRERKSGEKWLSSCEESVFGEQMALGDREFLELLLANLGIGKLQIGERVDDRGGHHQTGEPFVVSRDHVPRGLL